jgi:protein tyrosine/serine phosphatase
VRSDAPDELTDAGWQALRDHGIETIVDLRDEREREALPARAEGAAIHASVLDFSEEAFWESLRQAPWDTLGFYRAILARWPERFAAAFRAVARAEAGGVLIHCQVGRDRTGLLAALLLTVAGVPAEEIAADYALSADRLRPLYVRLIREATDEAARAELEQENVSEAAWMLALLDELDAERYLLDGGCAAADLDAVRTRLIA